MPGTIFFSSVQLNTMNENEKCVKNQRRTTVHILNILSDRRSKKKKSRVTLCVIDATYSPCWRKKKYCARCNNTMYTGYATKEKNTSQSREGGVWFLRLALHNHVFVSFVVVFCLRSEGAVRDDARYNDVNLSAWFCTLFTQTRTCGVVCVWYVCGNEIPDLKKKTPLAPPFFFYEWDIIQKLYNTTVVNMHTPTYIRTYIHTHALDNSFLFWRRAQLTFSPRLVICTHGKSLPYLLISHGSLSLHLYIALFFPSFFTFSVRLSSFFFSFTCSDVRTSLRR